MRYQLYLFLLFLPRAYAVPIEIYTWNLEHLAENNGVGCKPRQVCFGEMHWVRMGYA